MEDIPKSGEFYRQLKNRLYQIITVAEQAETGEQLVIYQALYGDYKIYAKPLEMFMSEAVHVNDPNAGQKDRSKKADPRENGLAAENTERLCGEPEEPDAAEEQQDTQENGVDAKLMKFLDTDDFEARYHILVSMRDSITDMQINNLAVALDVVIPEGDLDDRYEQLMMCLRTRQRYENTRLR